MKIITLANQKGGVGKTTTAQILAIGLSNRGYKVLMLDCDAQCNLTYVFGIKSEQNTIYELMKNEATLKDCVVSVSNGLDIIPGNLLLNGADTIFNKPATAPFILKKALNNVSEYDFCVIDTSPNLGIMTINALVATDFLIIPMTPDCFTLQGLSHLNENIEDVKCINTSLKVSGILLTRCDRTTVTGMLKEDILSAATIMKTKVFNSIISQCVKIRECQLLQSDIFKESPKGKTTSEYNSFIDEFLESEVLCNDIE